ncbi:SigE family RNA polymerase sigma factor [Actinoplanes couchii]|uniref:RNA polymerase sigma24 factor n=1 Tax=Actinoplanes couchii TaxID=403638 RepID=A0ABQ3X241_9ACTN|nr:SigE family RNA polymerase sigma factor [Actinoplanes couchii]MDR6316922.1 RNA polymerase sigma-70 factor (sigma-E family) [Actinoplanes couchii]GID52529.1 RNA polymerase sigma24 factor [Actinoplanes couchii]
MREGSDDEYTEYVTARIPALRRLAYLLTGDGHRADDLVQQTITTLYVKWSRARDADHVDAYVRQMLVRTYLDERRLAWARVRLLWETPEPAPATDDGREDRELVRAALGRVSRRQQAVLVLRFYYDLPVDEVAALIGCSPGTVKTQTSRGLAALRRLLGPSLEDFPLSAARLPAASS